MNAIYLIFAAWVLAMAAATVLIGLINMIGARHDMRARKRVMNTYYYVRRW